MKQRRSIKWLKILLICTLVSGVAGVHSASGIDQASTATQTTAELSEISSSTLPDYTQWKVDALSSSKRVPAETTPVLLDAASFVELSDPALFQVNDTNELVWKSDKGWAEWEIDIAVGGLYNIALVYKSLGAVGEDIFRSILIDGKAPYKEAEGLRLKRIFTNATYPANRDSFGNDIRSASVESEDWKSENVFNYDADALPLLWNLTAGKHKLRIVGVRQPMLLKQIIVQPPVQGISRTLESGGTANQDWIEIIEAENVSRKSNPNVQWDTLNDADLSPESKGMIRYNVLGGERFREGGQWVEWDVEVPADSNYQLGFKFLQNINNNFPSYRQIMVDGKYVGTDGLPFSFKFSKNWGGMTLKDTDDNTLLIPLKKGKHTIRFLVTAEPVRVIQERIVVEMQRLAVIEKDIRKITGNFEKSSLTAGNSDTNRDWDLESYMPNLKADMLKVINGFREQADALAEITYGNSLVENGLRSTASDLTKLRNRTRNIPNRLNQFVTMQNNLSLWTYEMIYQPLALDFLWIAEKNAELPKTSTGFFKRTAHSITSFFRTFTIDYDFRRKNKQAIDVWVNRGRDYTNLIQQLADETFTTETGISVNVNLIPDPQMLILGNAAGIQPDVALGVDQAIPVDFASRGALADLSQFADYEEAAAQFLPNSMALFNYKGKSYALPEVQSFNVMFYRKDLLDELNLQPPNTWKDVYKLLPTLQQNGYNFYINPKDYITYIYQNGGDLYTPDGMNSALDDDKSLAGFRQWTNFFSLYQLPKEVPSFFNHFRFGDIPIGISDFNSYLQILFAAPELAGKWKMVPIPGIEQADGEVARWSGGVMQAGIIFNKSKKQEQAWKFLKWWTSTETQKRFGKDIEGIYGAEYRWNTANVDAFKEMFWSEDELAALLEQKRWYKEALQVPGGYFTTRQMDFAWNRVVVSGGNIRESLEIATEDINREMVRKQIEFKLRDEKGVIISDINQKSPEGSELP